MTTQELTQHTFQGASIRTIQDDKGRVLFAGRDVATALGYANTKDALARHCKGVVNHYPLATAGGTQQARFITEGDLYRLIASSKLPEAQAFEAWIFDEVLPSIRRHGVYATPSTVEAMLADPDTMIQALTSLKEERAARAALEARVAEDAPLTRFARTLVASDADLLVRQVAAAITAQGVRVSQPVLFTWLRENGWLCRNKGRLWNSPTQWALDKGFMRSSVILIATNHGDEEKVTPKITTAGQADLVDGFLTGRYTISERTVA